jgi:Neuraminidase (sialidase)
MTTRRFRSSTRLTLLVALLLSIAACTGSDPTTTEPNRAGDPVAEGEDEGLEEELEEQAEKTESRLEALEAAREAGTLGLIEQLVRHPAPGWAGERLMHPRADDWEPAIAADPNARWVYVLHNRYGGKDACPNECPDPAMILHVSRDGGRTWQPERYLCVCRGWNAQYDPLIEVVPETGDVVAVWMNQFKIHFSRSSDHGKTWSKAVFVHPEVRWGDKPNFAVSPNGQDVYVQFNGPTGGDNHASVSHDGGSTWSTTQITDGRRYYFAYGGAVLPDDSVVFSQVSLSYTGPGGAAEGTQNVHVFRSDDGGGTWSEIVVDELELGRECVSAGCYADYYDSGPALAQDDDGDLVIVYNGASEHLGPQAVYARSSTDGGVTWSEPVQLSKPGVNSAFPAAVGDGDDGARVWFMAQKDRKWKVWYRATADLGQTWTTRQLLSDAVSGTAYKHPKGFDEVYGDYGEIAVRSDGRTVAVWGEGTSYIGPGGIWFNRER